MPSLQVLIHNCHFLSFANQVISKLTIGSTFKLEPTFSCQVPSTLHKDFLAFQCRMSQIHFKHNHKPTINHFSQKPRFSLLLGDCCFQEALLPSDDRQDQNTDIGVYVCTHKNIHQRRTFTLILLSLLMLIKTMNPHQFFLVTKDQTQGLVHERQMLYLQVSSPFLHTDISDCYLTLQGPLELSPQWFLKYPSPQRELLAHVNLYLTSLSLLPPPAQSPPLLGSDMPRHTLLCEGLLICLSSDQAAYFLLFFLTRIRTELPRREKRKRRTLLELKEKLTNNTKEKKGHH